MDQLTQHMMMAAAADQDPLRLVVDTSLNSKYTIFFRHPVNVLVDWGDGSTETIVNASLTGATGKSHTWASTAEFNITVTGSAFGFGQTSFGASQNAATKCLSFGDLGIVSLSGAFLNHTNLIEVPSAIPPTVTDLSSMFFEATSFNYGIGLWETSNITNMSGMFFNALAFNQDIGGWDVSSVSNMGSAFRGASAFNQNIGGWDVSSVSNMDSMFQDATAFNQNLSGIVTGMTAQPTLFSSGANATFANNANGLKPFLSDGVTQINT